MIMIWYTEYFALLAFIVISFVLAFVLLIVSYAVSMSIPYSEKESAYECGFDPYEDARDIFNVRFYVVAILFIIFDLETSFFLPWCISFSFLSSLGFWSMLEFLIELLIGFAYVWMVGALNWE